ncbi:4,5-DOPA dioxygenase extradiol-like [Silene latifolia]|uniref:4,5-DOPA dioxygenase extradiol-like n=1 Tax=Silene latifolia TaxID=37657 RepID=UPI003D77AC0D
MAMMSINNTFFISHGSPSISVDDSITARKFLKGWKEHVLEETPKAILVVSGHWETPQPTLCAVDGLFDTTHDFYGYPPPMYKLKYPAQGATELAKRAQELLKGSGFNPVFTDEERGLDQGAWVPLMLMYPEAGIPVCVLSVQMHMDATHHFNMGRALTSLKDEGVLIIGSGGVINNMKEMHHSRFEPVQSWASEFDGWLEDALTSGRFQDVNEYLKKAPHAERAQPFPDHIYPLHVALGAAGENAKAELIHRSWDWATLSYSSYKFTDSPV